MTPTDVLSIVAGFVLAVAIVAAFVAIVAGLWFRFASWRRSRFVVHPPAGSTVVSVTVVYRSASGLGAVHAVPEAGDEEDSARMLAALAFTGEDGPQDGR